MEIRPRARERAGCGARAHGDLHGAWNCGNGEGEVVDIRLQAGGGSPAALVRPGSAGGSLVASRTDLAESVVRDVLSERG